MANGKVGNGKIIPLAEKSDIAFRIGELARKAVLTDEVIAEIAGAKIELFGLCAGAIRRGREPWEQRIVDELDELSSEEYARRGVRHIATIFDAMSIRLYRTSNPLYRTYSQYAAINKIIGDKGEWYDGMQDDIIPSDRNMIDFTIEAPGQSLIVLMSELLRSDGGYGSGYNLVNFEGILGKMTVDEIRRSFELVKIICAPDIVEWAANTAAFNHLKAIRTLGQLRKVFPAAEELLSDEFKEVVAEDEKVASVGMSLEEIQALLTSA